MSTHATGDGRAHMLLDDRSLALRCQQGDLGAYTELLRRHRRMVYGVARGIMGNADEAEDVAQETLVRAFRSIRQYNGCHEFRSWIRRITVNCAISRLRQRKRERHHLEGPATMSHDPGRAADPVEHLMAGETGKAIRTAAAVLPLKQRLAFTLFHLDDMNLAETALAMGCTVNAVKVHLHRARRRLAFRLAAKLEEG